MQLSFISLLFAGAALAHNHPWPTGTGYGCPPVPTGHPGYECHPHNGGWKNRRHHYPTGTATGIPWPTGTERPRPACYSTTYAAVAGEATPTAAILPCWALPFPEPAIPTAGPHYSWPQLKARAEEI